MLVLTIVTNARESALLAFTVVIFALFAGILIYASITYHRERKDPEQYGDYEKTALAAERYPQMPSSVDVMTFGQPRQLGASGRV